MHIPLPAVPWLWTRQKPTPELVQTTPALTPRQRKYSTVSLRHYSTPGVPPPQTRVDPLLRRREALPIRIWDFWKFGLIVASKAKEVTHDVIVHHIWGPRRKSWGIEMTLITSLMRGIARHSSLVDIATIRMLMNIGGLVPLPSDALVTPVTFRVKRRNLRGILAELDSVESGYRELSGEWVVGKKTWQRLQAEWKAAKSEASSNNPSASQFSQKIHRHKERVILYIHGGAYYLGSAAAQRLISIPLSKFNDARVFALNYRLAPEVVFPGPLHDAVTHYFRLVEDLHIPPENIIIAGDSAGGGLSLALLMYLRDNDYALPGGVILMSPWVDLTMSCESWESNSQFDVVPFPEQNDYMNPISLYLGDNMERYLTHPYASPLFGNFKGLPPMLIQAGDAEVLRDEITLLAHKATLAGVDVRHELYEDAIHIFQMYPFLDASARSFMSTRDFVMNTLPQLQAHSLRQLDKSAEAGLKEEIDSDLASVVRGDGVETASGREEVREELSVESYGGSDTETETESKGKRAELVKYPSWGRSGIWSVHQTSSEELDSNSDEVDEDGGMPSARTEVTPDMPTRNALRRIQSALSVLRVLPDTPDSACATSTSAGTRNHHRTPTGPLTSRRQHHSDARYPTMPLLPGSLAANSALSLTIRRSLPTHPDIASLVTSWSLSGPVNQMLF